MRQGAAIGRKVLVTLAASAMGVVLAAGTGRAQPDAGEQALWPVAMEFGDGKSQPAILAWVPPGAKRIRAVLIIVINSDSKHFGEHAATHTVGQKQEMAVLYLRAGDEPEIQTILDLVAEKTGIAEFRHAPWIPFGKSSRGKFPIYMAWRHPKRTIATISYHAETPSWPVAEWAKLDGQTVLHVNANGETEWGGTWFNHVRPSLLNYRARSAWLPHQVVAKGVGHGDYVDANGSPGWGKPVPPGMTSCLRIWDYLALFVDKAIERRVPKDRYPTHGPVELKAVDDATGYLIDRFAVETLFGVPRLPLKEGPDGYLLNVGEDAPVSGYAAFSPPKDFAPPEGVPVVRPDTAVQGFGDWVLTESLRVPMKADPMLELGDLARLTPKPGDQVTIDGQTLTFARITPRLVAKEGGIALNTGLVPRGGKTTFLAFTVLEVPERKCYRLIAPFTAATRQQVVLNGVPVRHRQVLDLGPGRYPLLVVVRMAVKWGRIGPWLEDVTEAEVAQGKAIQMEVDARAAEEARMKAAGQPPPPVIIRRAADVPPAERKKMFWVADLEQAEAWLRLHNVRGQNIAVAEAK